jgi:hypothetical protein
MTIEFGNDAPFRIQSYLARFDAIFSINHNHEGGRSRQQDPAAAV